MENIQVELNKAFRVLMQVNTFLMPLSFQKLHKKLHKKCQSSHKKSAKTKIYGKIGYIKLKESVLFNG